MNVSNNFKTNYLKSTFSIGGVNSKFKITTINKRLTCVVPDGMKFSCTSDCPADNNGIAYQMTKIARVSNNTQICTKCIEKFASMALVCAVIYTNITVGMLTGKYKSAPQ